MGKYSIILICCIISAGCATLALDRDLVGDPGKITGTYNVVTVGGTFPADAERVVILDKMGDEYSFRPVTGPGRVKEYPGLAADVALKKVVDFFSDHCAYRGYTVKKLTWPGSGFIGYEITPDYPASLCEDGNEVAVSYGSGPAGVIKVYTWLLQKIKDGGSDGPKFSIKPK